MNILHVTKRYPNSMGGDAIVVVNYESYQQANGHNVQILTSNCNEIVSKDNVHKFGVAVSNEAIDRINLQRILTLCMLSVYSFWLLKKLRPDVIHSHTPDMGFAVSLAARLYRIPVVNSSHGVAFNNPNFSNNKRKLEAFLLKRAHHAMYLTVDPHSVKDFQAMGIDNVKYIPNGVTPKKYKPEAIRKSVKNILFVGRLEWVKGVEFLLRAFHEVAAEVPTIDLNLVGVGADRDKYLQLVQSFGIADRVHFMGKIDNSKMAHIYAQNDIFILPSIHEGFPIVLLEAWASGIPAVVTSVGACADVCHNGVDALLIQPRAVEPIKKALMELIDNKALREKLQTHGRDNITKLYDYGVITKQLEQIYEEVCR